MEVMPGYKLTEVGVIPDEWAVRSIGQVFRLVNGCAFKPEDWKLTGTPIIRIQNLNDPFAPFNFSQAAVSDKNRVELGDLLFAWSGTLGSSFGARLWHGPAGVLNQHIFKVHMADRQITLPFSLLVFARVEEDIATQAHGFKASFVHVKKADLVKVWLPVPPLLEQDAIASVLGDVNALLAGLDRLIAKKRDLKQAAMQQLLTGHTRLPGFQGEWQVKPLGELSDVKTGPFGSSLHESDYVADGTPIITVEHLGEFGVEHVNLPMVSEVDCRRLHAYSLDAGDIVFSRVGSVDRNALIRPPEAGWLFSGRLLRVRPDQRQLWAQYLSYQFHSEPFKALVRSVAVGQTMASLNTQILKGINVAFPTLNEQTAIATILSDMDAELTALEARRDKTRALKQGMMQELLTGRTRLV